MTVNLEAFGFKEAPKEAPKRLVASVEALQKRGKTRFALTAPEPIYVVNIDNSLEGVVEEFKDKVIYVKDINSPDVLAENVDKNKAEYSRVWNDIQKTLDAIWKDGEGTLVLDTASEAWEICRLARFGKLTQVMPHDYTFVNNQWRELIRHAYVSPMNTILLHKMKPSYNNPSILEMKGFGETSFLTQVHVRLEREDPDKFSMKIMDCRHKPQLNGKVIAPAKELVNFDWLLKNVHGG